MSEVTEEVVLLNVEGAVATITLNRPKQLNALNEQVLRELSQIFDSLAEMADTVHIVIVQGTGRAFAAGADIAAMQALPAAAAQEFSLLGQVAFRKLERLPQPTIALIQGYALGGGLELALGCDIRIAAEGTKLGLPEVTLGVLPGFGGSQRLPRIVGQGRALQLLMTGDQIDATEAYRIGLVTQVVPAEELTTAGQKLTERLMSVGPLALRFVKQAVYEGAESGLDVGLRMESSLFGLAFSTEDQKEGMKAFLERRKAEFRGR